MAHTSKAVPTALITGASSGIGKELAKIHAERGGNVVLVARRKDRLEILKKELESQHGVQALILAQDLAQSDAAEAVHAAVEEAGWQVDYLINNAGFGGHGRFWERDPALDAAMIDVNVRALTLLTRAFVPQMIQRGRGRILNVASTAGFLPGPLQAVYYASKAYVVSFSAALSEELAGTGVKVTALCPGPVQTEFFQVADAEGVELTKRMVASPRKVAEVGYRAMLAGRRLAFDKPLLGMALRRVVPLMPLGLVLKISRKTMEKS